MDKTKIKRIVAREGLIFLPFIALSPFFLWQRMEILRAADNWKNSAIPTPANIHIQKLDNDSFLFWLIIPYALMVIIRFLIWAIKTLREGK